MAAQPSADAEKFDKLREKCNQLKQANAVLKKGLLEKQEDCARLEQQGKEKDSTLRQQVEEIDHLQFQNSRLTKQIATLNAQVEELQKQKQQSGWSVQGFISGKQQQEAVQKSEDEIRMLRDELVMKIQENEGLHMQLYEFKRNAEEEVESLREENAVTCRELEGKAADLDIERHKTSRLISEAEDLEQRVQATVNERAQANMLAASTQRMLEDERRESKKVVNAMQAQFTRWVPFNEAQHAPWNLWNRGSRHGREVQLRKLALQQLFGSVSEACKQCCIVFQMWATAFGIGNDGEPANCLRVRRKMVDAAQRFSALVGETFPQMIGSLGSAWTRPSSIWDSHFKQSVATFLQTHRRWVFYQSLLLLHGTNSAHTDRSPQVLSQAGNFVDCLWRLHRRLRSLFTKVRLLFQMSVLTTRSCSSIHFALARSRIKEPRTRKNVGSLPSLEPPSGRGGSTKRVSKNCSNGGMTTDEEHLPAALAKPTTVVTVPSAAAIADLNRSTALLMKSMHGLVQDVAQCWEGIGRCLSSWATAQASGGSSAAAQDGSSVVQLLEALHGLYTTATDLVCPALDGVAAEVPWPVNGTTSRDSATMLGLVSPMELMLRSDAPSRGDSARPSTGCLDGYLANAVLRLRQAPDSVGFEESVQTRLIARQLSAMRLRLSGEVRQLLRRLQEVTGEREGLTEELRSLQDSHALLQSNFQVLKSGTASQGRAEDAPPAGLDCAAGLAVAENGTGAADLLLDSRQRALLDNLSITSQQGAALRQHGFFVDTISMTPYEAELAAGPPDMQTIESWEMAVRKVYEVHARSLQAQVRAADARAMELHLSAQEKMDLVREQEEVRQKLREDVVARENQLASVLEEIVTTRKNYDAQLGMLTEHICSLSARLSEKDASVAALQTHKILCGHCGTWNPMGKLLSSETGGKCQTCKEKVISRGK